jgi:hypothetical protein
MAAVARTSRLASRLASISRPTIAPRASIPAFQRAGFSVSASRTKSEVIKETEVPVSVYNPDAKGAASSTPGHFSIPVKGSRPSAPPVAEENDTVTPLDEKVYKQMPRTLQKMSVMGKVIIITG